MICNWKYDDIVNLFRPFRSDVWKGMNTEQQEGALQAMLDFYSQRLLGIERLCEVHIRPFGDDKEARYEPSINEIVLREDMAQKGVINCINGDKKTYDHPSKHIFFYMMHEFKHAMQRYYMLNPESCLDKVELMLVQNNQSNKNPNINSYIKPTSCDQTKSSVCLYPLYSIQPIERYAWDFAHKEAAEFEAAMSSLFPDDAAFKKRTKYSSFFFDDVERQ